MPWQRSSFRACSDCALLRMTSRTCSLEDKCFVIVTPSILDGGHAVNVRYLWRQTFAYTHRHLAQDVDRPALPHDRHLRCYKATHTGWVLCKSGVSRRTQQLKSTLDTAYTRCAGSLHYWYLAGSLLSNTHVILEIYWSKCASKIVKIDLDLTMFCCIVFNIVGLLHCIRLLA